MMTTRAKLVREAHTKEVDGAGFRRRLDKWIKHTYPGHIVPKSKRPLL